MSQSRYYRPRRWRRVAVWFVAALSALAAGWLFCTDAGDELPPKTVAALAGVDSLERTHAPDSARNARAADSTAEYKRVAAAALDSAARTTRAAARLQAVVDSLRARPVGPSPSDSAAHWRAVADTQAVLVDSLALANLQLWGALALKSAALASAEARAARLQLRLDVAERLDSQLAAAVREVNRCTIPLTFGKARCLTRTESAALGAGVGAGGAQLVRAAIRAVVL